MKNYEKLLVFCKVLTFFLSKKKSVNRNSKILIILPRDKNIKEIMCPY